jgi:hypothetical protein
MCSNIYHNLRSRINFGIQLRFQLLQSLDRDKSVVNFQVSSEYRKTYLLIEVLIHDAALPY